MQLGSESANLTTSQKLWYKVCSQALGCQKPPQNIGCDTLVGYILNDSLLFPNTLTTAV